MLNAGLWEVRVHHAAITVLLQLCYELMTPGVVPSRPARPRRVIYSSSMAVRITMYARPDWSEMATDCPKQPLKDAPAPSVENGEAPPGWDPYEGWRQRVLEPRLEQRRRDRHKKPGR